MQKPTPNSHTPVDYGAFTDAQHYEQMGRLVANVSSRFPMMMDATRREDGMALACGDRIVTMSRSITRNLSDLEEGWHIRERARWDREICSDPVFGAMARRGGGSGRTSHLKAVSVPG